MGFILTVTSGKGGVGKSTTTANVATGLAKNGKKVVAVDYYIVGYIVFCNRLFF